MKLADMRETVESAGLRVSMVTADCHVPLNTDRGPDSLRDIGPSLNVAETLGCDLIRVCLKNSDDIPWAQRAADVALGRGMRLAHQCHTTTLFEQIERSLEVLNQIDRPNFGLIYEPANLPSVWRALRSRGAAKAGTTYYERLRAESSSRSSGPRRVGDVVPGASAISSSASLGIRWYRFPGCREGLAGDWLRWMSDGPTSIMRI